MEGESMDENIWQSSTLVLIVQEDDAKDKEASHHGESGGVVGEGCWNEALVLVVVVRVCSSLLGHFQIAVAQFVVADTELVNTEGIGNGELGAIESLTVVLERSSDGGVEHDILEEHVTASEGDPLSLGTIPLLKSNFEFDRSAQSVRLRILFSAAHGVVSKVDSTKEAAFVESPLGDFIREVFVSRLGMIGKGSINSYLEVAVAEEIHRAGDHHASVVGKLNTSNQQSVRASGFGLIDLTIRLRNKSRIFTSENFNHIWRTHVGTMSGTMVDHRGLHRSSKNGRLLAELRGSKDSVISGNLVVQGNEVEVVDGHILVRLQINAAFISELTEDISGRVSNSDEDVFASINEFHK